MEVMFTSTLSSATWPNVLLLNTLQQSFFIHSFWITIGRLFTVLGQVALRENTSYLKIILSCMENKNLDSCELEMIMITVQAHLQPLLQMHPAYSPEIKRVKKTLTVKH